MINTYRENRGMLAFIICCLLCLLVSAVQYETNILEDNNRYRVFGAAGLGLSTRTGVYSTYTVSSGEYIPQGVNVDDYRFGMPICDEEVRWNSMLRDEGTLKITVENSMEKESNLSVPLLYYKGYRAKNNSDGMVFDVYRGVNGMATITLPTNYKGEIAFHFVSPWYWHLAELTTMLTMLVLFLLAFQKRIRRLVDEIKKVKGE